MPTDFSIRLMLPSDSPALEALENKTVDTGRVGFKTSYIQPYYAIQQALRRDFTGLVAEVPGYEGLVGTGIMSFGKCQIEGEVHPFAYFGGLGVHEDFRRMGIASALAARRVELARERIGPNGIILAGVQAGNEGSLKTAMKWANLKFENRSGGILGKTTSKPPKPTANLTVRTADENDLEEIAQKQNAFYAETNLYPPKTAAQLQQWLSERPFDCELNRYYIAVDPQGCIQAGIGITREGCLITNNVTRMPKPLKVLNYFLRLVPANGASKSLNMHWFWFQPDQARAGKFIWDSIRFLERENANMCFMFYDQAGKTVQAISPPRFIPSSGGHILINSPIPFSQDRSLYFNRMMI